MTEDVAYTGRNTTMTVAVPPAAAGSAVGTAVDAVVQYRSPAVQGGAFSLPSAVVATHTRLVEPDTPPAPVISARKHFQLEAAGGPAEYAADHGVWYVGCQFLTTVPVSLMRRYEGLTAVGLARVRHRRQGTATWSGPDNVGVADRKYTATITGLESGTTYEMQTSVCNSEGCSPYSTVAEGQTLPNLLAIGSVPPPANLAAVSASDTYARALSCRTALSGVCNTGRVCTVLGAEWSSGPGKNRRPHTLT